MARVPTFIAAAALLLPGLAGSALAQDATGASAQRTVSACQSEQDLQQVINSDGQLSPDGCRQITITPVRSENGQLCVLDFANGDEGIINQLRSAAMPDKWWVRCDSLTGAG
ncbi:hypothetical protein [Aurantimonas sp. VKM B-3413]|uniref:hypothetical protein n=1 Tax=Aurantimonas sp. VKM B-3413 TaxID=2779401 RepID=UPI001E6462B6|nr:hypothetical protein [Aurantimonas sp. VKM B-3413]MCB8836647.1 hypothetical protein [Aurantimonas sp. VKM B-3413]